MRHVSTERDSSAKHIALLLGNFLRVVRNFKLAPSLIRTAAIAILRPQQSMTSKLGSLQNTPSCWKEAAHVSEPAQNAHMQALLCSWPDRHSKRASNYRTYPRTTSINMVYARTWCQYCGGMRTRSPASCTPLMACFITSRPSPGVGQDARKFFVPSTTSVVVVGLR